MEIIPKDKWIQYFAAIGIVTMGIMAFIQSHNLTVSYKQARAYSQDERMQFEETSQEPTPTVTEENETDLMY